MALLLLSRLHPSILHPAVLRQGKYDEAQPYFDRSLSIDEKSLGPDHPSTITSRAWIADNLKKKGDLVAARPVMEEIVASRERVQGPDHPDVAASLNSLAQLLQVRGSTT